MNRRIKKKRMKIQLGTPTPFIATGGFLTPYACPTCGTFYRYEAALNTKICPECGQHLIWYEVFN